jgi:PAS domain S-box-containing protein
MASAVEPVALYAEVARAAQQQLGTAGMSVYVSDADAGVLSLVYSAGHSAANPSAAVANDLPVLPWSVVWNSRPAYVSDLAAELAAKPSVRLAELVRDGIQSFALLPLRSVTGERGMIALRYTRHNAFGSAERALLEGFALHVGLAFGTALRFERERAERQLAEAAECLAQAALAPEPGAALANEAVRIFGTLDGVLGVKLKARRDDGQSYQIIASAGRFREAVGRVLPAEFSFSHVVMTSGDLTFIPDPRAVARPEMMAHMPDGSVTMLPLVARALPIGTLMLLSAPGSALPAHTAAVLRRLAPALSVALAAVQRAAQERHEAERERLLAAALTSIPEPILLVDPAGVVRYANDAAVAEYGFAQNELVGTPFGTLRQDRRDANDPVSPTRIGDVAFRDEPQEWHRRKNGSAFLARVGARDVPVPRGAAPAGQVVSVRNVSAANRLAEQQRQQEKLASLGELTAGVAHELNNPLTGISAFTEMLLEETLADDHRESLLMVKKEADRARIVIRDLLAFSRKSSADPIAVDLADVCASTMRLRAYHLRSAGVDVTETYEPTPPIVGDAQRLQQVVLNLLANAEHAVIGIDAPAIRLSVHPDGQYVVLLLQDNGHGMPPDVRTRIFEPFYTTKPEGLGTGLGLSVSYGIIQSHGGVVTVDTAPGRGTRFEIRLPAAQPAMSPATGTSR